MLIKSYSKINLSLRVLKRLKSGLHDIESNSFLINLFDEIEIKKIKNKNDIIIFKGKFIKHINKKNNSIVITLNLLRKLKILKDRYKIVINKKIPVFSGLGGGTSNAFFLVKYFFKKKLNKKIIAILEKKIGSDLRLFLHKQIHQKKLKKILNYKKKFNFYILIVYSNLKCSTKEIYSKVNNFNPPSKVEYSKIKDKDKLLEFLSKDINNLQGIVEKKSYKIKKIVSYIKSLKGCNISRMTGSGSVCFGIFKNRLLAIKGLKKIKRKFPKYWSIFTKTI